MIKKNYQIKTLYLIIMIMIIILFLTIIISMSVNPWTKDYTKYKLNTYFPEKYQLKTFIYKKNTENLIEYPCIIKPVTCSGTNRDVKLLKNKNDLNKFMMNKQINDNNNNDNEKEEYIIQEYYNSKYEVGILYEKLPFYKNGQIKSIVLKKAGDDWEPLKCKNIKSSNGVECEDLTKKINLEKINKRIIEISNRIPNFYVGRYDIGFNDMTDFINGENFKIYELNGVMGFDLRSNIANNNEKYNLTKYYYILRWLFVRFYIGLINLLTFKSSLINCLTTMPNMYKNYKKCNDWEHLFQPSPG